MKLQNVPRKKVADGIPNAIYIRCGWEPGDDKLSEREELLKRRNFAENQGASEKSLAMLDEISNAYEEKYNFLSNL